MKPRVLLAVCFFLSLTIATNADTLTVSNVNDSLPGSLRKAIQDAAPNDTINFSLPSGSVITLTSGELLIDKNLTISGPGANYLTVQRSDSAAPSRIWKIASGNFSVSISGLTIAGGNPPGFFPDGAGGAIQSNSTGSLSVTTCTISGNSSEIGGGVANISTGGLIVSNCTFSDNIATQSDGGGIYNNVAGAVTVTNSTFTSNTSLQGNAGGIFNSTGILTVTNCTFTGNSCASFGGGIANYSTLNLKNSIVALNTALDDSGPDIGGSVTSQGYNLIGNDNAATIAPPNQTGDQVGTAASPIDPKLDPAGLKDNGGQTKTISLQSSSTAIDSGDPAAPGRDQRNYVRQDPPDIGAFEFGAFISNTLANLSTRAFVDTGDDVMIVGLIVTGGGAKSVLLRALGPTLGQPAFNVPDVLADPVLELHDSAGAIITSNDNWGDAANAGSIPPALQPANSAESAILTGLDPGAYTAVLRGVNNGTGNALLEAYDLDYTAGSKLGNASTRAFVQTGDNVMIAGLIVHGPDNESLLIRALGPTLGQPPSNVPDALADPTLDLYDGSGTLITSNDDWKDTQQTEIQATGLPPPNDSESAIAMTMTPGSYTAIVRGKNNGTGNALVEVYGLN